MCSPEKYHLKITIIIIIINTTWKKTIHTDVTPIVCSSCQRHFLRTSSRITRSQKSIVRHVCFFCSGGGRTLPSSTTFTITYAFPHRYLILHAKIWPHIRQFLCQLSLYLAHKKYPGIFCYGIRPTWLYRACHFTSISISDPIEPTMTMTNASH